MTTNHVADTATCPQEERAKRLVEKLGLLGLHGGRLRGGVSHPLLPNSVFNHVRGEGATTAEKAGKATFDQLSF